MLLLLAHLATSTEEQCTGDWPGTIESTYYFCKKGTNEICSNSYSFYGGESYNYGSKTWYSYDCASKLASKMKADSNDLNTKIYIAFSANAPACELYEFDSSSEIYFGSNGGSNDLDISTRQNFSLYLKGIYYIHGTESYLKGFYTDSNTYLYFKSYDSKPLLNTKDLMIRGSYSSFSIGKINCFRELIFNYKSETSFTIDSISDLKINMIYDKSGNTQSSGYGVKLKLIIIDDSLISILKDQFEIKYSENSQALLIQSKVFAGVTIDLPSYKELTLKYVSYNEIKYEGQKLYDSSFINIDASSFSSIVFLGDNWPKKSPFQDNFIYLHSSSSSTSGIIVKTYSSFVPAYIELSTLRIYLATSSTIHTLKVTNLYIVNQQTSALDLNIYSIASNNILVENNNVNIYVYDAESLIKLYDGHYNFVRKISFPSEINTESISFLENALIYSSEYDKKWDSEIMLPSNNYYIFGDELKYSIKTQEELDVTDFNKSLLNCRYYGNENEGFPAEKFRYITPNQVFRINPNMQDKEVFKAFSPVPKQESKGGIWNYKDGTMNGYWKKTYEKSFTGNYVCTQQLIPLCPDAKVIYNNDWQKELECPDTSRVYLSLSSNGAVVNFVTMPYPVNFMAITARSNNNLYSFSVDLVGGSKVSDLVIECDKIDFNAGSEVRRIPFRTLNITGRLGANSDPLYLDFSGVQTMEISFEDYVKSPSSFDKVRNLYIYGISGVNSMIINDNKLFLSLTSNSKNIEVEVNLGPNLVREFQMSGTIDFNMIESNYPIKIRDSSEITFNIVSIKKYSNKIVPVTIESSYSVTFVLKNPEIAGIPFSVDTAYLVLNGESVQSERAYNYVFNHPVSIKSTLTVNTQRSQIIFNDLEVKSSSFYTPKENLNQYPVTVLNSLKCQQDSLGSNFDKSVTFQGDKLIIIINTGQSSAINVQTKLQQLSYVELKLNDYDSDIGYLNFASSNSIPTPDRFIVDLSLKKNHYTDYMHNPEQESGSTVLDFYKKSFVDPSGRFVSDEIEESKTINVACGQLFDCESWRQRLELIGSSWTTNYTTVSYHSPTCTDVPFYHNYENEGSPISKRCLQIKYDKKYTASLVEEAQEAKKLTGGQIAGISIGVILVVAIIIVVVLVFVFKINLKCFMKKKEMSQSENE